jgi:hypothetical protein
MDRAWKQLRIGILAAILALLVVVAFMMYLPRGIALTLSKREREIKGKLEAIKPPPGARLLRISVHHDRDDVWEGTAVHTVSAGFEDAKSYYIKELARNGFIYKTGAEQKSSRDRFCSPDYGAELIPLMRSDGALSSDGLPSLYLISMNWKDTKC